MAKKSDLVKRAVEMELGTAEEMEALTSADLRDLIGGDDPDEAPVDPAPAPAPAPAPKHKTEEERDPKVITVDDLIRLGRIGVSKDK